MPILMSSTRDQEAKIESLSAYLLQQVFPQYIHGGITEMIEAEQFFQLTDEALSRIESLQDASRVIKALNTIISILESKTLSLDYEELFSESIHTLRSYQILFPFSLSFFVERKPTEYS